MQIEPDIIVGSLVVRDVVGDLISGSATIGGGVTELQFDVMAGTLDFVLDVLGAFGTFDLPTELNPEFNQSTDVLAGSVNATITIPLFLDFTLGILDDDDSRLIVEGQITAHRMPRLAGDYNANGVVEQGDLDLVLLHWGAEASAAPPSWQNARPSGRIDQDELDGVLLNWGASAAQGAAPVAVPEPSSLAILVVIATAAASYFATSADFK